ATTNDRRPLAAAATMANPRQKSSVREQVIQALGGTREDRQCRGTGLMFDPVAETGYRRIQRRRPDISAAQDIGTSFPSWNTACMEFEAVSYAAPAPNSMQVLTLLALVSDRVIFPSVYIAAYCIALE